KLSLYYIAPRLALAEMDQKARSYSETIRIANDVLAVDPANADAKLWHAAGMIGNKDYNNARTELNGLLRQYPDSANVNLHMAVLDTAEKKYHDAEVRYLRLYKPGQADLRPLEGLIQLYDAEKQVEKSLTLLEGELKQAPDSQPVHLLLAGTAARAGKL